MKELLLNACATIEYWQGILPDYNFYIRLDKAGLSFSLHEDYADKNLRDIIYSYGKELKTQESYYKEFIVPTVHFENYEERINYWKQFKSIDEINM